jgi:hypothetical protein
LWTPDREQRDLRQLVVHRHKLVEIRSRVKNELQNLYASVRFRPAPPALSIACRMFRKSLKGLL